MLRTALVLDGSISINSSADYLPSRLLALRPHIFRLVDAIIESAFAAQIAVSVMRDGVAHKVCGLTNNALEISGALEKKYFMFGGSGCMSLENGLRLALSELVTIKKADAASADDSSLRRIIVIVASVTSVDHSDIFSIFHVLKKHHVTVDVLSLCGATHLTTQLAQQTGGRFLCPMNYDQLREGFDSFVASPEALLMRDGAAPPLLHVAFPKLVREPEGPEYVVCSRCLAPLPTVPCTCPQCKVLICSLPYVHAAFAKMQQLAAPSTREQSRAEAQEACAECGVLLLQVGGDEVFRCTACTSVRCAQCESHIRTVLHICPTCVSLA